jgi:hypothetical protein
VLSAISSIHRCIFHSHNTKFEQQGYKKTIKKQKTKNKKKLNPNLHFDSSNHGSPLSYLFGSELIDFSLKLMPCKINHNLICLDLQPLSKGLGTKFEALDQ